MRRTARDRSSFISRSGASLIIIPRAYPYATINGESRNRTRISRLASRSRSIQIVTDLVKLSGREQRGDSSLSRIIAFELVEFARCAR